MPIPQDPQPEQPRVEAAHEESHTPKWEVWRSRAAQWICDRAERVGLHHDHAPHWVIALFTFGLLVFAFAAWEESKNTTKALQDQLAVLIAQQDPFIFHADGQDINPNPFTLTPQFEGSTGRIKWIFAFKNFGKGPAYTVTRDVYIKVEQNLFTPDTEHNRKGISTIPQGKTVFGTGYYYRSGFSKDDFDRAMDTDGGIQIKVEFFYADSSGKQNFTSSFCLAHLANGNMTEQTAESCHD